MKKFITLENGNQVLKEANSRQNYIAESGLTLVLDFAVSESYKIVLNENCNLSFLNFEGGAVYTLLVKQGVGNKTITFPVNVKWQGGNPPTLSTNTGKIDLITLYYDDQENIFLGGSVTDYA